MPRSNAFLIVEQGGLARVFDRGVLRNRAFLDISGKVSKGGEQGLLSVAFHPLYRRNGRVFVYYTDGAGAITISEFRNRRKDLSPLDLRAEKVLLRIPKRFSNHNGGILLFGPDGYLYTGTGDGGSGGDPDGNAQDLSVLLGKILRLDVSRAGRYRIPRANPFVGVKGARGEIWAFGLRNPWRFSFDRANGRLFLGDVGQSAREEIDIVVRGGNYGWNIREGKICYLPREGCRSRGLRAPIYDYGRSDGISVIGGYVYRGRSIPALRGKYLFGDFGSDNLWALSETRRGGWQRTDLVNISGTLSSFAEDSHGELYALTLGGTIFKLRAA